VRTPRVLYAIALIVLCVAATAGFSGSAAAATAPTSIVGPSDITNDLFANNEESLGMDPTGTLLAGAWNDWEYNDGCGFSYSTDGGASWAPESFAPFTMFSNTPGVDPIFPTQFAIAGDPAVAYNPKSGVFDVMCQAFGTRTGSQIQLLSTTFDPSEADRNADVNVSYGRAAWQLPPVAVATGSARGKQKGSNGQFPDHESIIVDTTQNQPYSHYGRLYVAWAEFSGFGRSPIDVAYSDNDGRTWTGPIRVSDNGHQFDQDAVPRVGPDGTLYISWINGPNESSLKNNVAMIDASHDGGATWGADHVVAPIVAPVPGQLPNSKYRVFSDVNSAVDQATGVVVISFIDEATGAAQVYATHTATPGDLDSFTTPARVKATAREQFFPWMSAAANGRVDLVFYDRSCDTADTNNCVTLASSSDGGGSWTNDYLLSSGFDGDQWQACLAFVDPQPFCGNYFLGDYIAVASNNTKAAVLYTGNGAHAMDVFSIQALFAP
jgi:hypothetical protein